MKYRHREDGYEKEAEELHFSFGQRLFSVKGYYGQDKIVLAAKDFEKLFEPVDGGYCCEPFYRMVYKEVFWNSLDGWQLQYDVSNSIVITSCPFCGRKLQGE